MKQFLQGDGYAGLLGTSPAMQPIFDTIRKVSSSDAPVLILGESGTGKEMVARAIHQRSPRHQKPFVAINCGAIPETLLESELFGHERGAYTGAHVQRKGRVELAHGGTLFLDEVGEMPTAIQVKLLRFLQEKRIERIGGREEIPVDARVLAATNVDLQKAMAAGTFREDLFYRLAVVQTTLPPLRERDSDIMLLARSFLDAYAAESRKSGLLFGQEATKAILNHSWPGNVRELQNRVRRAVVMCETKRITPGDLDLGHVTAVEQPQTLKEAREEIERTMVRQSLRKHAGSITHAAADLGISRPTFYDLMNKLGLDKSAVRE
jgi:two-component system NtrC family response regulator